jgi:aspartate/methionine/tyrosine aminotransferase
LASTTQPTPSRRTASFTESVIREMTRVAHEHGAVNLAQGFPDFPAPTVLKEEACRAIRADVNQYATTWGSASLRTALAGWYGDRYGMDVDPEREVTVTCGATEAMASVFLALLDPGEEVIVPEPYYENYGPDAILAGARPLFLPLDPPAYRLDRDRIESLVSPRTRAIVLNTPVAAVIGCDTGAPELEGRRASVWLPAAAPTVSTAFTCGCSRWTGLWCAPAPTSALSIGIRVTPHS